MLNDIRVSNNHKINALTALSQNQVNPEDTEIYRHYKEAFDSLYRSVTAQTTQIRSSLADIENQKVRTLDALRREHSFTSKSQQDELVRSIVSELTVAVSSSEIEPLVKQFAAGDSRPLAKKLCETQKKEAVESVIGQLCINTPGPSRQDFYHALVENQATGDKTIARRVFTEQTRATLFGCERLHRSYQKLAFAEQEKSEADNEGGCYWVPASIKHEEKVSTDSLSRYSFFIYGGVNLQARINVNQRAVSFNRQAVIRGFQDHHIISDKNKFTQNHHLMRLAGLDLQSRANKMYLPSAAHLHETRSIHWKKHRNVYSENIAKRMDDIVVRGKQEGWSPAQYRAATGQLLTNLRQELKAGNIALNKHHRPWAK